MNLSKNCKSVGYKTHKSLRVSQLPHCLADFFLVQIFQILHPDSDVVLAAVWEQFDA